MKLKSVKFLHSGVLQDLPFFCKIFPVISLHNKDVISYHKQCYCAKRATIVIVITPLFRY